MRVSGNKSSKPQQHPPPHYTVTADVSSGTQVWSCYYASLPSVRSTMILLKVSDSWLRPVLPVQLCSIILNRSPQMLQQLGFCSAARSACLICGLYVIIQRVRICYDAMYNKLSGYPCTNTNEATFCVFVSLSGIKWFDFWCAQIRHFIFFLCFSSFLFIFVEICLVSVYCCGVCRWLHVNQTVVNFFFCHFCQCSLSFCRWCSLIFFVLTQCSCWNTSLAI